MKATNKIVGWFQGWWKQDRFKESSKTSLEKKRKSFKDLDTIDPKRRSHANTSFTSNKNQQTLHIIPDDRAMRLKHNLLNQLNRNGGDVSDPQVIHDINALAGLHDPLSNELDTGNWTILSKPKFQECLGTNSDGQYIYTLGRMCFDMFPRSDLKCSIRGTFNIISKPSVDETELRGRLPKFVKREHLKRIMNYK